MQNSVQTSVSLFGLVLLAALLLVGILGAVRLIRGVYLAFTAGRYQGGVRFLLTVIGIGLFATILLSTFLGVSSTEIKHQTGPYAVHHSQPAVLTPSEKSPESSLKVDVAPTVKTVDDEKADSKLPAWAQVETQVITDGEVPNVRLVRKSRACATEAEARAEAIAFSKAGLMVRLTETYPDMSSWDMPLETFEKHCVTNTHTQQVMKNFGTFESPMYHAYVQFADSPNVREHLLNEWGRLTTDRRIRQSSLVFGGAILGLGLLSVMFRSLSRLRRTTPVMNSADTAQT